MAYEAPTAENLSQDIRAALRSELPESDAWIWPNNLYVVSKAFAQALRGAYLRLEWLHKQLHASTAEAEDLEAIGRDIGITRNEPTYASGKCSATTTIGVEVPENTEFQKTDGTVYITTNAKIATGTTTEFNIRSKEPGRDFNALGSTPLTLVTPIVGVSNVTVTADGITGGTDIENDASLRARILLKKRNPPHGGSPNEYISWAREIPGVTRVFVARATPAAGQVSIYFMMDDTYSDGLPQAGDITTLQTHLDSVAPANAEIIVDAPTPVEIDITITNLKPNSQVVKDAVEAELMAMFRRRAEPGTAADDFVFSKSWIAEAISNATGENRHQLTAPAGDTNCGAGELAILGTITYV